LHLDLQMAAREVIASTTVDDLLADRGPIADRMLAAVAPMAEGYGIRVLATGIKDIIFAPRVRDLLLKEMEAKRLAHAALVGAREEVAAMRALLNAVRLAEEHPQLLRLRELEVARSAVQSGAATVMLGAPAGPITPLPQRSTNAARRIDQTDDREPDE